MQRLFSRSFVLGLCAVALLSCNDPEDVCPSCDPGEDVWGCENVPGSLLPQYFCAPDEFTAFNFCEVTLGGNLADKTTCDDQGEGGETGSSAWNPGAHISWDATRKAYTIEAAFYQSVLDEPDQLLFDSARVDGTADGPLILVGVYTGSAAAELGLQNSDELISLNGLDISSWEAALTARAKLAAKTTLTLKIRRAGRNKKIKYIIE